MSQVFQKFSVNSLTCTANMFGISSLLVEAAIRGEQLLWPNVFSKDDVVCMEQECYFFTMSADSFKAEPDFYNILLIFFSFSISNNANSSL